MNHHYLLQIFLTFLLIFSLTSGRALSYDELNSDEYEGKSDNFYYIFVSYTVFFLLERQDSESKMSNPIDTNYGIADEEKELDQRSILSSSHASQTRQQIIDILRKAYHQGWKPNLKHHMPGTRFGRNR